MNIYQALIEQPEPCTLGGAGRAAKKESPKSCDKAVCTDISSPLTSLFPA